MGNEDCGESSKQSDSDLERPLKKARHVWQVKGKYHLKANCEPKSDPSREGDSLEQSVREERKCIDKFLAKTESFLDSDDDEALARNIEKSIFTEIPITLVSPSLRNQDYYLKKWQSRQIARAYIDNTINKVLENWSSAPFDAEDFVENCENDGRVENQGILMAIEAHGLQSAGPREEVARSLVEPEGLPGRTGEQIDTARRLANLGLAQLKDKVVPELEAELGWGIEYPVSVLNAAILVAIERKGLSSNN